MIDGELEGNQPSTMRLFSGSFLPLATLSSMDDHMPFSASSLLFRLVSLRIAKEPELRVAVLRFIPVQSRCGLKLSCRKGIVVIGQKSCV